jgi:hypothetical protein
VPDPSAPPPSARIREALALRRWALPALCGAPDAAPSVSRDGWHTFLRAERCAAALLALGDGRLGAGAEVVRGRATRETQRMLSAGAQLHLLGAAARKGGWSVVVMKGGVPLAEGRRGADLVDVDVLAAPAQAQALGEALDAAGFNASGRDASHRLAERSAPDAVQIEIHTGVPGIGAAEGFLGRALPARVRGLLVPHPADQLWHVLLHSVSQHMGRRGSLRELVVLADALGRAAPEDVAEAKAQAAGRRDEPALLAQLELARALHEQRPPAGDPFVSVAAAVYVVVERVAPLSLPDAVKSVIAEATFNAVARRAGTAPQPAPSRGLLRDVVRRMPEWLATPPALFLMRTASGLAASTPASSPS